MISSKLIFMQKINNNKSLKEAKIFELVMH